MLGKRQYNDLIYSEQCVEILDSGVIQEKIPFDNFLKNFFNISDDPHSFSIITPIKIDNPIGIIKFHQRISFRDPYIEIIPENLIHRRFIKCFALNKSFVISFVPNTKYLGCDAKIEIIKPYDYGDGIHFWFGKKKSMNIVCKLGFDDIKIAVSTNAQQFYIPYVLKICVHNIVIEINILCVGKNYHSNYNKQKKINFYFLKIYFLADLVNILIGQSLFNQ